MDRPFAPGWLRPAQRLVIDAVDGLRTALDADLIGTYLFGSIVTGDFDAALSDIDLVTVTHSGLTTEQFHRLDSVHHALTQRSPD